MRWPDADTFYLVDVFTDTRYEGNPLAVVFSDMASDQMLKVTREMNHSETTFVSPQAADGSWPVRIWTPGGEIPFAGHPTLGTAFVLKEWLGVGEEPLILKEGVGPIRVEREQGDHGFRYWMTAPSPVLGEILSPEAGADLLGLTVDDIDPRFPVQAVSAGLSALIVPLRRGEGARRAQLNRSLYQALVRVGAPTSVLVFCSDVVDLGHQLHVRVFVGDFSVPEDPATGSANAALAGYLQHYGVFGQTVDVAVEQGVEMGRPSTLYLKASGKGHQIAVKIGGDVVAVAQGQLL